MQPKKTGYLLPFFIIFYFYNNKNVIKKCLKNDILQSISKNDMQKIRVAFHGNVCSMKGETLQSWPQIDEKAAKWSNFGPSRHIITHIVKNFAW